MCLMGIAYCFHSIAAGCSDVGEGETVTYRCPSLSSIFEDCFEDWAQTGLFDSYRLQRKMSTMSLTNKICTKLTWH